MFLKRKRWKYPKSIKKINKLESQTTRGNFWSTSGMNCWKLLKTWYSCSTVFRNHPENTHFFSYVLRKIEFDRFENSENRLILRSLQQPQLEIFVAKFAFDFGFAHQCQEKVKMITSFIGNRKAAECISALIWIDCYWKFSYGKIYVDGRIGVSTCCINSRIVARKSERHLLWHAKEQPNLSTQNYANRHHHKRKVIFWSSVANIFYFRQWQFFVILFWSTKRTYIYICHVILLKVYLNF